MSREKPILFSTEMVKAILADRKTKTRRLNGLKEINENPDQWSFSGFSYNTKKGHLEADFYDPDMNIKRVKCPWKIGDILWVRETWNQALNTETDELGYVYKEQMLRENVIYTDLDDDPIKWRSSRYMPKIAARLFLEVKDIQVERLQNITEEDAIAEGVAQMEWRDYFGNVRPTTPKESFSQLWNSINAKRGYAWELNNWVWVVEFERVEA